MSYQVAITIATSQKEYPSGTVSAGIKVSLGVLSKMMTTNPVYFDDVPPGTYPISIQAVDPQGKGIDMALTGSVTLDPDKVLILTPDSFSVSTSPMNSWNAIENIDSVPNINAVIP